MNKFGAQAYDIINGQAGWSPIVSAAANTNGVIIRTCSLVSPGGWVLLRVGGKVVFANATGNPPKLIGDQPFIVEAGVLIEWSAEAAGGRCVMTYDLL